MLVARIMYPCVPTVAKSHRNLHTPPDTTIIAPRITLRHHRHDSIPQHPARGTNLRESRSASLGLARSEWPPHGHRMATAWPPSATAPMPSPPPAGGSQMHARNDPSHRSALDNDGGRPSVELRRACDILCGTEHVHPIISLVARHSLQSVLAVQRVLGHHVEAVTRVLAL